MYQLIASLLVYFIYFVVALCLWHYAIPDKVKKEVKRLLGIFFKWVLFGRKPKEPEKKTEQEVKKKRFSFKES